MDVRVVATLIALAGCDRAFGLHDLGGQADGAKPACGAPAITDDFAGTGAPCATWAFATSINTTMVLDSGALVITPVATAAGSHGDCLARAPMPFVGDGAFVQVSAVGLGMTEYTTLYVGLDSALNDTYTMGVAGMRLGFARNNQTFGSVPWDPVGTRWWRIRPREDGAATVGEYSADGLAWTRLGVEQVTPPTDVTISVGAGTYATEPVAGTARFESLDVCP